MSKRLRADGELGPAGDADGKLEVPDEPFGIVHKEKQVLGTRGDSAQDSHDELDVNGLLDIARLYHERHVVHHSGVVDLELRLGARLVEFSAVFPHGLEGVGEDEVFREAEILFLPFELPFLDISG